jgi:serine/threonine protein kinase/TolB-like protein/Flp pilus assembly protein TadD
LTAFDRWQRVRALLEEVVDLPADERGAYLAAAGTHTSGVRAEVESLLRAHDRAGSFLEPSPSPQTDTGPGPAPSAALDHGTRLGPFELVAPLGAGGMGQVYRALDTRLGREVAVKLLAPSLAARVNGGRWLEHEARAISRLTHPHICVLHDVGVARLENGSELEFLVMELVEGETLATRLRRGALPADEAVTYGTQMAVALAAAHARGIVHGDLKPSNVVLASTGVKLLDFGLARLSQPATPDGTAEETNWRGPVDAIAGTLAYMAPEVLLGRSADERTDIHALGVVLYEMVSARRPFEAASAPELLRAIVDTAPHPLPEGLDAPEALARLIDRCLAKGPEDRWQRADDVAEALRTISRRPAREARHSVRSWRRTSVLVTTASALALALLGLTYGGGARVPLLHRSEVAAPVLRSVTVLPFESLSGDDAQEYLAAGMTEALGMRLSALKRLRVISSRSAIQFTGKYLAVADISRTLNVDGVIAGSVQRAGGRIRVSAQLLLGPTGETLWSGSFDREMDDVLRLQRELAQVIAQQIDRTLTGPEPATATVAANVYEEYLKGLFELRKLTRPSLNAALGHFQAVLAENPSFALAELGVAEAYVSLGTLIVGAHPAAEMRPHARAAVMRALELDPQLARAHALLGRLEDEEWQWAEAEARYRHALALDPSLVDAHAGLGWLLVCRGRLEEGIASSRLARELDPLSVIPGFMLGVALNALRRPREAIEVFESVLARHPDDASVLAFLGLSLIDDGSAAVGVGVVERAVSISNRNSYYLGMLAWAYARTDRRTDAHRVVRELQQRRQAEYVTPGAFIFAFAGLGDVDATMRALDQAYDERANIVKWVQIAPVFDLLRGDPRFASVVRRVALE